MGPCVLSISPWSADIGSVGSALGRAQALLIWNLSLHAWTWSVLVDILWPIGELVVIPKPSKPHKAFLSVLVRCRQHVVLPHNCSWVSICESSSSSSPITVFLFQFFDETWRNTSTNLNVRRMIIRILCFLLLKLHSRLTVITRGKK